MGKFTEPIYENVPFLWNSKEARSRALSAPEIKSPSTKNHQSVQSVKEEKQEENMLGMSSSMTTSSIESSDAAPTVIIHSSEHSFGK